MAQAQLVPTDVFQINGRGTIVTGYLISGVLAPEMRFNLRGEEAVVKEIETPAGKLASADASGGQIHIGVLLDRELPKEMFKPLALSQTPIVFDVTPAVQTLPPEPVGTKPSNFPWLIVFLLLMGIIIYFWLKL